MHHQIASEFACLKPLGFQVLPLAERQSDGSRPEDGPEKHVHPTCFFSKRSNVDRMKSKKGGDIHEEIQDTV